MKPITNNNCSSEVHRMKKENPVPYELKKAGFTLVEILVVLTIITILAGFVGFNVLSRPNEARIAAAKMQLKTLQAAVQFYHAEQGRFPTQAQGLAALVRKPVIPPIPARYPEGGYLDSRNVPRDPWGNEYIYLLPGRDGRPFEIISYGADGEPGGVDDNADLSSAD